MNWYMIAAVGPLFFVGYQALSKFLPKDISIFLVNMYASLISAALMLLLHFLFSETKSSLFDAKYTFLVIGMGICIGLGNFAVIKAYSLGAPQSEFTALFYPLLITYGTIVGFLVWHEKFTLIQGLGFLLTLVGLLLITLFKK